MASLSPEVSGIATAEIETPKDVVARNAALNGQLMRYLLQHPQVLESLPDQFELVILPDYDPEMRAYNLELLDTYTNQQTPVVFARMSAASEQPVMNFYVPLAA